MAEIGNLGNFTQEIMLHLEQADKLAADLGATVEKVKEDLFGKEGNEPANGAVGKIPETCKTIVIHTMIDRILNRIDSALQLFNKI